MGIKLTQDDKDNIVELNKLFETEGYSVLKAHFYREILEAISLKTTEKDTAYYAGQKSVFEYVERKVKILEKFHNDD